METSKAKALLIRLLSDKYSPIHNLTIEHPAACNPPNWQNLLGAWDMNRWLNLGPKIRLIMQHF